MSKTHTRRDFLDCLALTFCDVIGELLPEWACLTLQGGTTFPLTSKSADIPVPRVRSWDLASCEIVFSISEEKSKIKVYAGRMTDGQTDGWREGKTMRYDNSSLEPRLRCSSLKHCKYAGHMFLHIKSCTEKLLHARIKFQGSTFCIEIVKLTRGATVTGFAPVMSFCCKGLY